MGSQKPGSIFSCGFNFNFPFVEPIAKKNKKKLEAGDEEQIKIFLRSYFGFFNWRIQKKGSSWNYSCFDLTNTV